MEFTTLGRTGLKVSVAGLGAGGPSRVGQRTGVPRERTVGLIHRAIDLGINFFDTAQNYGTEAVLGEALRAVPRESVVISSKRGISRDTTARDIIGALNDSLHALGTDYLDLFHLHGLLPEDYDHAVEVLVPALLRERERGKFRFLGVTESTSVDLDHVMLARAVTDDCWDVIMVTVNLMHQGARPHILPAAKRRGIGTLIMAPARCLVNRPDRLAEEIRALVKAGALPAELGQADDPLGFLVHEGGAENLMDAAYRFARFETGGDVVLFGTGNLAHLEANVASLLRPALPRADVDRLVALFGHLRGLGLDQSRQDAAQAP